MPLAIGTRLGSYEVTAKIGEGGMGEVYRARDTRLKRDVAIKVLPDLVANDVDRLARFQREAEVLASLNHPNIAHLYGLEGQAGRAGHAGTDPAFLVMELVEGEDLSQKIEGQRARGEGLPLETALAIAKQIADALEAAHERGIVHRDLKPANIKVTDDGMVKVLDFGLAKAMAPDAAGATTDLSRSPTITTPAMTLAGVILGTAAYMSPEQAAGRTADKRSDVWAFGVVLMEMLTGRLVFTGETVSHVLAAVLKSEPDWATLPAETPPAIRKLLRRCLEKDRKRRLADAADARLEIEEALAAPSAADSAGARTGSMPRRWVVATVSAAVLLVAVTALATWTLTRPAPVRLQPARFAVVPSAATVFANNGTDRDLVISPDGTHLVYTASGQLMVRAIDQLDAVPLVGISGARFPFFSPDGRWIGFFTGSSLKKVLITGGPAVTLCSIASGPRGATWSSSDTIIFATGDTSTGLLSVPAGGGEPKVLTQPDQAQGEQDHILPSVLPGGRAVLFTVLSTGIIDNALVAVLDLTTGQRKTLIRGGSQAEYVDTGHLLYGLAGTLRAVRFDPVRLEVLGDPVPILDKIMTLATGAGNFTVSRQGTLAYVPSGTGVGAGPLRSLVWVDRQGHEELIPATPRTFAYPRISPDGSLVALDIRDRDNDIWIWDFARKTLRQLTFGTANDYYPVWTPDGHRIVFYSTRSSAGDLFSQSADGTGTPERLTNNPNGAQWAFSMSPDGKSVVSQQTGTKTGRDLSLIQMDPPHRIEPLIQTPAIETNGEISQDGRWLAYQSDVSGQDEIYVNSFPKVDEGHWLISTGGGTRPLWARNGRELFYIDDGGYLTSVPVQTTPTFSPGNPVRVLNTKYFTGLGGLTQAGRTYDVSKDGQRFLMIKDNPTNDQTSPPPSIVVVLNWSEELKARVPAK